MKRAVIGIIAVLVLSVTGGLRAQEETKSSPDSHLGTWQLASYKYGSEQQSFTTFTHSQRRLKLITETHFTWVQFEWRGTSST
jgi:hypothetical protein